MKTHSARYFREAILADFELICSFRETYKFCDDLSFDELWAKHASQKLAAKSASTASYFCESWATSWLKPTATNPSRFKRLWR
jgi:hypothetical protein